MKVEESIDLAFEPDVRVADGERGRGRAGLDDHAACTRPGTRRTTCASRSPRSGVLFPGDHVMGWSTTVVSPPDGDMAAYIDSLRKVAGRRRPHVLADARAGDRASRSATSTRSSSTAWSASGRCSTPCASGLAEIPAIVAVLYADVDEKLHKPAGRSVLAHLVKLVDEGAVRVAGGGRPASPPLRADLTEC